MYQGRCESKVLLNDFVIVVSEIYIYNIYKYTPYIKCIKQKTFSQRMV